MSRFARALLAMVAPLAITLGGVCPAAAQSDARVWVRDEIRINMRSGPGDGFRILRTLSSGASLRVMGQDGDWLNVATGDGTEGWVPRRYVAPEMPASVALPIVEAEKTEALEQADSLRVQLASLHEAATELESLRTRNDQLESENAQLVRADRSQQLMLGAGIMLVGILLGIFWRHGSASNSLASGKRLKL